MEIIPYTHIDILKIFLKKGIQFELFTDWWRLLMITNLWANKTNHQAESEPIPWGGQEWAALNNKEC